MQDSKNNPKGGKMKFKEVVFSFLIFSVFLFSDPIPSTPQIEKEKTQPQIKGIVSPQIELKNGRKVLVKKFNIVGNKKVSLKEIEKVTKEYEGKEISVSDLKVVADKITEIYWNKGYITSFAYVPAQKVVDGVIEIKIVEGKVGEIKVQGNKYYTSEFIDKHFENVKKGDVLNRKNLERSLLILNEYPKLNVNADLTKGKQEGTTDLIVNVEDRFPFQMNVFANNYGSRYTGRTRSGLNLDFGNLTKNGDVLSLSIMGNVEDLDLLKYYKIGYTMPIWGTGSKVGLSWSKLDYEIDKELAPLGVNGKSEIYSLYFQYPFIKERNQNLNLFASLNHKNMKNYLFESTYINSNDKYSTLEIGLERDKLCPNSHLYWTAKATFGLGEFLGGMRDDEYTGSSRPGLADGTWAKLNVDLVDIFKLGKAQLLTRFSTQLTTDNLLTGEQMVLGGPDTVRGYPTGEYLGDYGYFTSLELRTPLLPGDSFLNKYANWAFFVDHGSVYKKDSLPGEKDRNSATGIGAGIRIYIPCQFHIRFDAARSVGGDEPSNGKDWQYWVQGVFNF